MNDEIASGIDEKERLREKALETEAITLGRKMGFDAHEKLTNELSRRSTHEYGATKFMHLADRDLFLVRARESFIAEFERPL